MTPGNAILDAIIASPADEALRLVYADYLEENGRPDRADFIRVQVELDNLRDNTWERRRLEVRQDELLAAWGKDWLAQEWPEATGQPMTSATFRRGFVVELRLRGAGLNDAQVREMATRPQLGLVEAIDLGDNEITQVAVAALAASPCIGRLRFLDLSYRSSWADTVEWPPALAVLFSVYGQAPVQGDGFVGQAPFYFRSRWDTWTFAISEDPELDPTDVYQSGDRQFYWEDHYGEGAYEASYMPHDEARRIIRRCVEEYRKAKGWDD